MTVLYLPDITCTSKHRLETNYMKMSLHSTLNLQKNTFRITGHNQAELSRYNVKTVIHHHLEANCLSAVPVIQQKTLRRLVAWPVLRFPIVPFYHCDSPTAFPIIEFS